MKRPLIISNLPAFQQFIARRARAKTTEPTYGRLIGRKLKISTEPTCPGWYPDSPPIELIPLELPAPNEAREWWRELLYGEIVDFRICDEEPYTIAVIAKASIWSSIPDLHISGVKSQYRIVDENRFAQMVSAPVFDQMIGECTHIGISIRRVSIPVKFSPARHARNRPNSRTPAREKSDHKSQ